MVLADIYSFDNCGLRLRTSFKALMKDRLVFQTAQKLSTGATAMAISLPRSGCYSPFYGYWYGNSLNGTNFHDQNLFEVGINPTIARWTQVTGSEKFSASLSSPSRWEISAIHS